MQDKIIRQYYLLSCLFNAGGMSVISAIYVTYLIKNGLNLFEVNLANAVYFATLFICEIPTGAFADIFGRKTSFVAACALMCLSMFIYGMSSTFSGFILAEIVGAIGSTFRSGAFQAWLVDSLKHHGYEGELNSVFGKENLIRQIGGGIGAVLGSHLSTLNSSLPWFVGGTVLLLTTIIAKMTMREDYFTKGEISWKKGLISMRDTAKVSIKYSMENLAVRFILIITCLQIFSVQALNMYWQPYMKQMNIEEKRYGLIFVAMLSCLAIGSFIVSKMNCISREKRYILISQAMTGFIIITAMLMKTPAIVIVLFAAHEIPRGAWGPLIDSYMQKRIPSSERATISSFCSISPHIGGVFGLLISGMIAEYMSISAAWIFSGTCLITSSLIILSRKND